MEFSGFMDTTSSSRMSMVFSFKERRNAKFISDGNPLRCSPSSTHWYCTGGKSILLIYKMCEESEKIVQSVPWVPRNCKHFRFVRK